MDLLEEFQWEPSSCKRVAAGAAWLDETEPGWERRVDTSLLDIQDPGQCICGQVLKGGWSDTDNKDAEWLALRGFLYGEDTDQWIALIKERFDSGILSDDFVGHH